MESLLWLVSSIPSSWSQASVDDASASVAAHATMQDRLSRDEFKSDI
jgi:hypothetical protein